MLSTLVERTQHTSDDVKQLRHVLLEGNGVPPLTTQVATLNQRMDAADAKAADGNENRRWSRSDRYTIWASLGTGLIALAEMVLRHAHIIGTGGHGG